MGVENVKAAYVEPPNQLGHVVEHIVLVVPFTGKSFRRLGTGQDGYEVNPRRFGRFTVTLPIPDVDRGVGLAVQLLTPLPHRFETTGIWLGRGLVVLSKHAFEPGLVQPALPHSKGQVLASSTGYDPQAMSEGTQSVQGRGGAFDSPAREGHHFSPPGIHEHLHVAPRIVPLQRRREIPAISYQLRIGELRPAQNGRNPTMTVGVRFETRNQSVVQVEHQIEWRVSLGPPRRFSPIAKWRRLVGFGLTSAGSSPCFGARTFTHWVAFAFRIQPIDFSLPKH